MEILVAALSALIEEAHRLSSLDGSKGRVIRRFFERVFPLTVSIPTPYAGSALLQALFVNAIDRRLAGINGYDRYFIDPDGGQAAFALSRKPVTIYSDHIDVTIELTGPLPELMKDRQVLLERFGYCFGMLSNVAYRAPVELVYPVIEAIEEELGDGAVKRLEPLIVQAIQGDCSKLADMPIPVLDLAALLNPQVKLEIDEVLLEEHLFLKAA